MLMAQLYLQQQKLRQNQTTYKILDAMSASGLRALRYAQELDKQLPLEIVANDLSEAACKAIQYNIQNQIKQIPQQHKIIVNQQDCNTYMQKNQNSFDIIDLDPYGAPSQFINYAIKAIRNYGLLSVTATDGLITCGHGGLNECVVRYQSIPAQADFCHEFSVRMVIGQIAQEAIQNRCGIKVLFSFYMYHYLRVYIQIIKKGSLVKDLMQQIRTTSYCKKCSYSQWNQSIYDEKIHENQTTCPFCKQKLFTAGPVYYGNLADEQILDQIIQIQLPEPLNLKTIEHIKSTCKYLKHELNMKNFHVNFSKFCSFNNNVTIAKTAVYNYLTSMNFKCVNTMYSSCSIKTDADFQTINNLMIWWNTVCQLEKHKEVKEYNNIKVNRESAQLLIKQQFIHIDDQTLQQILDLTTSNDSQINVSPKPNKNSDFEQMRKIKMFQDNPEKNFGPKKMK